MADIAEIVGVFAARKRWTGRGFYCNNVRICFSCQFILYKRRGDSAEVTPAAAASNHIIRIFIDKFKLLFRLKSIIDWCKKYLIHNRTEAVARVFGVEVATSTASLIAVPRLPVLPGSFSKILRPILVELLGLAKTLPP